MVSTFVYSKFSPPSRNAVVLMQAVCRRADELGRRIGGMPGD
jgi:hypothetical protein